MQSDVQLSLVPSRGTELTQTWLHRSRGATSAVVTVPGQTRRLPMGGTADGRGHPMSTQDTPSGVGRDPYGHGIQWEPLEIVSVGHGAQTLPDAGADPGGHWTHTSRVRDAMRPEQTLQPDAPAWDTDPGGQGVQPDWSPPEDTVPGRQGSQNGNPARPGGQPTGQVDAKSMYFSRINVSLQLYNGDSVVDSARRLLWLLGLGHEKITDVLKHALFATTTSLSRPQHPDWASQQS